MFSLNLLFVACIIFSLVFYFYFKTKQIRSILPIRKKWYKAKAGLAMGIFLIVFGINAVIIYEASTISVVIAAIFVLYGAITAWNHYKRVQHEGQFVQAEYELNT